MISWWRISFGEEEIQKVAEAIREEHISQGPITEEFERKVGRLLDAPYVVGTTNGSMALLISLLACGIKPGDEVIVPNRTWIATAHAVALLGAKVVLVDVEEERPIIDDTKIEEKITPRTKAIIPVHLNGRSANMREINRIAAKYGISVIEDAAQALYSRNADGFLGLQSDIGCFSLAVAKIISTGQGGFMVVHDQEMYDKLKLIRIHGTASTIDAVWTQVGFNFRLTDVLAAIGLVQLDKLADNIANVKRIYQLYQEVIPRLDFLKFIPVDIEAGEIPTYIEVLCPERERLIQFLEERDIQTRPFYPDLHLAEYFGATGDFPNSRKYSEQGLFLPCGPAQPMDNIEQVLDVLHQYKRQRT